MYIPQNKTEVLPYPVLGQVLTEVSSGKVGRIKAFGTSWPAKICISNFEDTLLEGAYAYILARQQNTLLIVPQNWTHIQQLEKDVSDTVSSHKSIRVADRETVAVFIDGSNLFYAAAAMKTRIDYRRLLNHIVAQRPISGAFFYSGVNSSSYKERTFLSKIRREGYQVIQKELIIRSDGSKKANLDVEIALDMLLAAFQGDCSTLILVSGDGDFTYAVNTVKKKGLRVEVIGLRSMTSKALIHSANHYVDLDKIKGDICNRKRRSFGCKELSWSSQDIYEQQIG